ncbi:hypothetical protein JHK85_055505 [Glycine max]|nr:hypothetical protein JHK85_055505 [Glycine max]
METETRRKVEEMVLDILKKSNIEEATEFTIRVAASERLGIDLSDSPSRHFVRTVVESYLLSVAANEISKDAEKKENEDIAAKNDDDVKKGDVVAVPKLKRDDPERVICQLSSRRNLAVKHFKGTTLVSIREFYMKDGKLLPGSKEPPSDVSELFCPTSEVASCSFAALFVRFSLPIFWISLSSEQWSTFKKSVPAIEEAIKKMEGRIRLEPNGKQNGDASNSAVDVALEPNGKQNGDASNSVVDVAPLEPHGKQNGDASNSVVDVAALEPVVPIEQLKLKAAHVASLLIRERVGIGGQE